MKTANEKRDLFPGALELMVLRTLTLESLHGYALAARIRQRSDELLQIEEGSLYPALQRLLLAGLVKAQWEISATNRRVRTYSLTAKGKRHLERESARFESTFQAIQRVLGPLSDPQT
jgi:PadR family transcriptional regulator, regulatory protein PadR